MKRILLALAMLALLLPSAPRAEARVGVSIDFFYNNLSGGSWVEVGDYGYCWQPSIAVSDSRWRPYADGYWAYTDLGWTWVSYEDFGWATYHYGRWARLRHHGWVWVPGYEWGPAWVSWRTGGDYVGWAPLPPRRIGYRGGEVVYTGRPIGTSVDIEFDIGPAYYNFVNVRYIGAPVLREHIYAPTQNITYINQTVNVTNITYNNSTVYNYGPDYERLNAYSARPIQRLNLERQPVAEVSAAGQSGEFTKVQGDKLLVAAPQVISKPEEPVAPPAVKTKIETPDVETGWAGVSDQTAKAEIQEKIKKEDSKNVPPPQTAPKNPDPVNAAAPADASGTDTTTAPVATADAAPGTTASKADRKDNGKGKRERDTGAPVAQSQEADGSAPPETSVTGDTATAAAANEQRGRGKDKDRRGRDRVQPPAAEQAADAAAGATAPGSDSLAPGVRDSRRKQGKRGGQLPPSSVVTDPAAANAPGESAPAIPPTADGPKQEKNRGRGNKERSGDDNDAARVRAPDLQPGVDAPDRGLHTPNAGAANDQDAGGRGRGKMKRERTDAPPQIAPPDVAPQPQAPTREPLQERARGRRERQEPPPEMAPPPQAPAREMMQERARGRRERQEPPPEIAPPPQAPMRDMMQERGRGRRERQEAPPQMAPPPEAGPAAGGPPPQREGRGKPERKKKKDDGQPEEP